MFKIATWNVNSIKVRLEQALEWLETNQPDVFALQEIKTVNENFPLAAFEEAGYHAVFNGQKTYNGVAIISRSEPIDVVADIPNYADPQRRVLAATVDGVRVINVYVPNGASVDSDKYIYKLEWFEHLTQYIKKELTQHDKLIVLGDFNIAPDDRDVHDPKKWEGHVHVSEPEREALRQLLAIGLTDLFRNFEAGDGFYSWWDYRRAGFRRNAGLRIDHILVNQAFAKKSESCVIDVEPRKWERPSDHTVVCAAFKNS